MRPKISIIGAGFVGSTAAHFLAEKELGDIVLLDVNEGAAKGKALDLSEALPVMGCDVKITGTAQYGDTADSDVVIITAGLSRKPGMSRDELLQINAGIVKAASGEIKKRSPNAIVIVVTNPLDAMVYAAWKATGFPPQRVLGMAGVLDSSRMRFFIAEACGVSVKEVDAMVLGGHGDSMVPLMRFATVRGEPVEKFLPPEKIAAIVERTKNGGAEIVELLKTGSAYFAPAASISDMAEAIVRDQKRVLPCAAYLDGEYGARGIFAGVPVVLGRKGIEKVVAMELNAQEEADFLKTADHIKDMVNELEKFS